MSNKKRRVESYLITKSDQAVVANGTTAFATSAGVVNLGDGQLGVFDFNGLGSNPANVAIAPGTTTADSPEIFIAQGTPYSASPSPNNIAGQFKRTSESSGRIIGRNARLWKGTLYQAPVQCAVTLGAPTSSPLQINVNDLTAYEILTTFRGVRTDLNNSLSGRASIRVTYTTPDYSTLGTVAPLDALVQNLVHQTNMNSSLISSNNSKGVLPFVALAINSGGGTGVAIGSISTGTASGYGFNFDAQQVAALAEVVANTATTFITNSSTVEPIDLTTAGSATNCDIILQLGVDEQIAYVDRIPSRKVRLDVGLIDGFASTVNVQKPSLPIEGQGLSRQLKIRYDSSAGQRIYTQNRTEYPVILPPNYFVEDETYDIYLIEHFALTVPDDLVGYNDSPQKVIICVPHSNTTTKTQLEGVLNPYFASAGLLNVTI